MFVYNIYTFGHTNISVFAVCIYLPDVAVSSKREQIKARLVDGTIEKWKTKTWKIVAPIIAT